MMDAELLANIVEIVANSTNKHVLLVIGDQAIQILDETTLKGETK